MTVFAANIIEWVKRVAVMSPLVAKCYFFPRLMSRFSWLAVCVILITGCSTIIPQKTSSLISASAFPTEEEVNRALSGAVFLNTEISSIDLPEEDIFTLSEEMRDFLDFYVPRSATDKNKVRSLLRAIVNQGNLGIRYNPFKTFSAQDTFFMREGNCLSFTVMVIALAREVGLNAYFNEVDVPPVWDLQNDSTYVLYKHINAVVNVRRGGKQIIDLNLEEYDANYPQKRISDRHAEAQYYNNRSVEYIYDNNWFQAFRYIRKAISLEPQVGYLWGTLGSVYRRAGFFREAEVAFLQALKHSPDEPVSMSNLERLYRQMGDMEKAELYSSHARAFRLKNPYYLYYLAGQEHQKQNLQSAAEYIDAAIRRNKKDHRFYHLAAIIYQQLGERNRMWKNIMLAKKYATQSDDIAKYNNKLDKLLAFN